MLKKILWLIAGFVGLKLVNEIGYILINVPGEGVVLWKAILPALTGSLLLGFCLVKGNLFYDYSKFGTKKVKQIYKIISVSFGISICFMAAYYFITPLKPSNISNFKIGSSVSSYEECMSDGKVGRTTIELGLLKNFCENKFPDLKKLFNKLDASLVCRALDTSGVVLNIVIKEDLVSIDSLKEISFAKNSHDKNTLTFRGTGKDKDTLEPVTFLGEINPKNGSLQIRVVYDNNKKDPVIYNFSCYEK
jgi:hypothetical protein